MEFFVEADEELEVRTPYGLVLITGESIAVKKRGGRSWTKEIPFAKLPLVSDLINGEESDDEGDADGVEDAQAESKAEVG